jgi:hypothetical protein
MNSFVINIEFRLHAEARKKVASSQTAGSASHLASLEMEAQSSTLITSIERNKMGILCSSGKGQTM